MKRSKAAAKPTVARKTTPPGLSMLLSLFEVGNEDAAIFAAARRHVSELDNWRRGYVSLEPKAAVDIVYPSLNEAPADDTIMKAGLMIGAAMAWIVMTDLNGGAR